MIKYNRIMIINNDRNDIEWSKLFDDFSNVGTYKLITITMIWNNFALIVIKFYEMYKISGTRFFAEFKLKT